MLLYSEIDECSEGTHDCSQICTNTNGSFICGCNTGYLLDIDGSSCNGMQKQFVAFIHTSILKYILRYNYNYNKYTLCIIILVFTINEYAYTFVSIISVIDECSDGTHNCSQVCTNTASGFNCQCNIGFLLDTDRATCNGMYRKNTKCYSYILI